MSIWVKTKHQEESVQPQTGSSAGGRGREVLVTPQSLPCARKQADLFCIPERRRCKPGTTSPFVEMEALCEEQKLLLSLKEKVSGPGNSRLFRVLADVCEVHFLLFEVISETHEVKVRGDIDECMRHDCITILRQNLVHKKVKPDWERQRVESMTSS